MHARRALLFAAFGVAVAGSSGCGDVVLQSRYRTDPIVVDGHYDDWHGHMQFVEKADLSVGVTNDETDAYVIIAIGDREVQRKIMMTGMFLWFDPAGGKDRQFGIHYPLGISDAADFMKPQRTGAGDTRKLRDKLREESLDEAELIGAAGTARVTRATSNLPGVEVRASHEKGVMVIEYRVPLASAADQPYGIGAEPGQTVGVELVTPEVDLSAMQEEMREQRGEGREGGMPPGGREGGWDGDRDDGVRGPMGASRPETPKPIDVWATLVLARANAGD